LIVVAIIGILAAIAVSSYSVARRKAKLDIIADTVVSLIKEKQSLARSGKGVVGTDVEAQQGSKCYGLILSTDKPFIQILEMPYVAVGPMYADYCDENGKVISDFTEMENFKVLKIEKNNADASVLPLFFKPPNARPGYDYASNSQNVAGQQEPLINIVLGLSENDEMRTVSFDGSTGLVERVNNNPTSKP
jgi:hypothetical protein